MEGISLRKDEASHIAEIVLDRPEAMNAISTALAVRLAEVCALVAADPDVRAVVLSAAGERAFCVGADLKERNRMSDARHRRRSVRCSAARSTACGPCRSPRGRGIRLRARRRLRTRAELRPDRRRRHRRVRPAGDHGRPGARRRRHPARAAQAGPGPGQGPGVHRAQGGRGRGLPDRARRPPGPGGQARQAAAELAGHVARNSPVAVQAAKNAIDSGSGTGLAPGWTSRTPPGGRPRSPRTEKRASRRSTRRERRSGPPEWPGQ